MRSLIALSLSLLLAVTVAASGEIVGNVQGDDWDLPAFASPVPNSGFFTESLWWTNSLPVYTRGMDLAWRQLEPSKGSYSKDTEYTEDTPNLGQQVSFAEQLEDIGDEPFWMRIWISGVDWAPEWIDDDCDISPISGTDYDDQQHYPIWNSCYSNRILRLYKTVLIDWGVAEMDNFKFIFVPGAFTWCEFDFDMINIAAANDGLATGTFNSWYQGFISDLVELLGNKYSHKLVFTGEDYPYSDLNPFYPFYARDATDAGMGIRNGITEVFNHHLNEIPAYGITIGQNGYLVVDEDHPLRRLNAIVGAENECFDSCGFSVEAGELPYAVKMASLRILQMRVNWLYVTEESYMSDHTALYDWVELELGHNYCTAPDAWVALRIAEDTYWEDNDLKDWTGKPNVRNWERWLYQRDVEPDGVTVDGTLVKEDVISEGGESDNGRAIEGRRTDVGDDQNYIYFRVYERFAEVEGVEYQLKVTYLDSGTAQWNVEYTNATGTQATETVTNGNSGNYRTVTFDLGEATFEGAFTGNMDFRIYNGGASDVEVLFVRLVRATEFDSAACLARYFSDNSGDAAALQSFYATALF